MGRRRPFPLDKDLDAYLRRASEGKLFPPGRLERLAVQRHLREVKRARNRRYPWHWDPQLAAHAISFYPTFLRHGAGPHANKPFHLTPWQQFIVGSLAGWRRRSDGARRFRKAMLGVARKNGKTQLAAGISLEEYYAANPPDPMAEIYFSGAKREQADVAFRAALAMIDANPVLASRSGVLKDRVINSQYNSVLRPLTIGPSHGLNPSVVVIDELHEWRERHRKFLDALVTAGAARFSPLQLMITTAGDDLCDLWVEEDGYCVDVLESAARGKPIDDRYFVYLARIDADDDIFDESCWYKANPNLGISVNLDYLRDQANEARHKATARSGFERFHLNRMTGSTEQAIVPEVWSGAAGKFPRGWEELPCALGIDLGRTYDFAGVALTFCQGAIEHEADGDIRDRRRFFLRAQSWTCLDGEMAPLLRRPPLADHLASGGLIGHPGDSVDFEEVLEYVVSCCQQYNVVGVVFDPNGALLLATQIIRLTGVDTREFPQNWKHYNEPMRLLVKYLVDGRLIHDGCPCLAWQANNLTVKRNPQDMWMPDKTHKTRKIDAMAASIMSFERILYETGQARSFHSRNPVEYI